MNCIEEFSHSKEQTYLFRMHISKQGKRIAKASRLTTVHFYLPYSVASAIRHVCMKRNMKPHCCCPDVRPCRHYAMRRCCTVQPALARLPSLDPHGHHDSRHALQDRFRDYRVIGNAAVVSRVRCLKMSRAFWKKSLSTSIRQQF
ncbi:unnamed protein product [Chondrus crispus]|uniref:Uncharacterized protein n=1 Tax=Chondrus crispus TaxID=2769 RepID=R7QD78_CHOCR|nr:unnamed protein product [Chondrus crispus]CDF36462.1 unnamed protein product [Chondrus crispus]|eukprot:XP_005716281.1 unnamed protein product [Chondrus crispus]